MKNITLAFAFVALTRLASAQAEKPAAELVQEKDPMTDKVSSHYLIKAVDGTARLFVGCTVVTLNLALPAATIDHLVMGGASYTKGQMRLDEAKPSNMAFLSTDQQHLTVARAALGGSWHNNDGKAVRLLLASAQRVRFAVEGAGAFDFSLAGVDQIPLGCPAK